MKVLFPEPFGPIRPCTLPRLIVISTPLNARTPTKFFASPCTASKAWTIGIWLGAIILSLAFAFAESAAGADLKIGFTLSLTGGTDDYGKAARMGAQHALKE